LTAERFSKEIKKLGKAANFSVKVLDKKEIIKEKMGGLLAVNYWLPIASYIYYFRA
jgi:leucyl aminopeptidase